jgi:hypothetical protein
MSHGGINAIQHTKQLQIQYEMSWKIKQSWEISSQKYTYFYNQRVRSIDFNSYE